MKFLSTASRTAFTLALTRRSMGFSPSLSKYHSSSIIISSNNNNNAPTAHSVGRISSTQRFMSSSGEPVQIRQIDKEAMTEIIEDVEHSSRQESGYVIMDVRNMDEIAQTGKLSPCVESIPLPYIAQMNAFGMSEEDFEEQFGFEKPSLDETLVFSCKAGIRSMQAAQLAAMNGYTNIVNYKGGAMDWFQ